MKNWTKWYVCLMAGLIGCLFVTVGHFLFLSAKRRAAERPVVIPRFHGTDLAGNDWHPSAAPCLVLRITSDNCEFCVKRLLGKQVAKSLKSRHERETWQQFRVPELRSSNI
jgi:hypothetical protein